MRHCYPIDAMHPDAPPEVRRVRELYDQRHRMGFGEARASAVRDVVAEMIEGWLAEGEIHDG